MYRLPKMIFQSISEWPATKSAANHLQGGSTRITLDPVGAKQQRNLSVAAGGSEGLVVATYSVDASLIAQQAHRMLGGSTRHAPLPLLKLRCRKLGMSDLSPDAGAGHTASSMNCAPMKRRNRQRSSAEERYQASSKAL